ncbi:hypothetical protein F5I97DRAFT_1854036 [Phlebopus sp. FC_14]|nr:hypothetical protein F5I97DRAFT_1854036 [Phlebopus sp. FC_14]
MFSRVVIALYLVFLSLGFTVALPSPQLRDIGVRQVASAVSNALVSPTSVTTTSTVQTTNGPMAETCVLTFTPDGQQIQVVQNCTLSTEGSSVVSTLVTPSGTAGLISATPAPTGTPSVAASSSPVVAAAFVLPGTSMQVLPIGLGIYGGVTAIAIIIVALVTYERIQYRKVFRQRRLAEQGAAVGFSDMKGENM